MLLESGLQKQSLGPRAVWLKVALNLLEMQSQVGFPFESMAQLQESRGEAQAGWL
jgi:hypothetical protein